MNEPNNPHWRGQESATTEQSQHNNILSRIRNISSPFEFLFSAASSPSSGSKSSSKMHYEPEEDILLKQRIKREASRDYSYLQISSVHQYPPVIDSDIQAYNELHMEDIMTPTPTRPCSPLHHVSQVKYIVTNSNQKSASSGSLYSEDPMASSTSLNDNLSAQNMHSLSSSRSLSESEQDDTPPLTPDSLSALSLSSSTSSQIIHGSHDTYLPNEPIGPSSVRDYVYNIDDDSWELRRPHSLEIREGKKPARPVVRAPLAFPR